MKVAVFLFLLAVYYFVSITFLSVHYRQKSVDATLNGIVYGRNQNYAARDSCYQVAKRYEAKANRVLRWIGQ